MLASISLALVLHFQPALPLQASFTSLPFLSAPYSAVFSGGDRNDHGKKKKRRKRHKRGHHRKHRKKHDEPHGSPTPEPGTLSLLALAGLGLGLNRKRRRTLQG